MDVTLLGIRVGEVLLCFGTEIEQEVYGTEIGLESVAGIEYLTIGWEVPVGVRMLGSDGHPEVVGDIGGRMEIGSVLKRTIQFHFFDKEGSQGIVQIHESVIAMHQNAFQFILVIKEIRGGIVGRDDGTFHGSW